MYTSGTTGQPKGIHIKTESIAWLIKALRKRIPIKGRIVGVNGPLSFDTSVKQLFQILYGNTIVLIPDEFKRQPIRYKEFIQRENIEVIDMTPSMWEAIEPLPTNVDITLLGGEMITQIAFKKIKLAARWKTFYNLYGPTETTVDATVSEITPRQKRITLGTPLDEVSIKIKKNEIWIASPGMFLEYVNNPEKTKLSKIRVGGKTYYKTGDKGRLETFDGKKQLIVFGRLDRQCKIRGNRIELDEISHFTEKHPRIKRTYTAHYNDRILLFYIGEELTHKDISSYLQKKLETYKCPHQCVHIKQFPLNKNGKICEKTLIEHYITQKDIIEKKIETNKIGICHTVDKTLGIKSSKESDNFFGLGGDSISAIMLSNTYHKQGYILTVEDIYRAETLKDIEKNILKIDNKKKQTKTSNRLKLLPIHHRFVRMIKNDMHHWNQSFLIKIKDHKITKEVINKRIEELVSFQDILRTKYVIDEKQGLIIKEIRRQDYTADQVRVSSHKKYSKKIINSIQGKFRENQFPLFHFALFEYERLLFATFHHLIIDGISIRLIADWIFDNNARPPTDPHMYFRWCQYVNNDNTAISEWYNQYLSQKGSQKLVIESKLTTRESQIKKHHVRIKKDKTEDFIKASSKKLMNGSNTLLLHALSKTLYEMFHIKNIWIDMESHGRENIDGLNLTQAIGWFTSIYPVYLDYENNEDLKCILDLHANLSNIKPFINKFGVTKYIRNDTNENHRKNNHSVKFNFLGKFKEQSESYDFIFQRHSFDISNNCESPYAIEIEVVIIQDQLNINLKMDPKKLSEKNIAQLSEQYKENIIHTAEVILKGKSISAVFNPIPSSRNMLSHQVKGAYIEQFLFKFDKKLSLESIRDIWNKLISRHEVLRSTFINTKNGTKQVILNENNNEHFQYRKISHEDEIKKLLYIDRFSEYEINNQLASFNRIYLVEGTNNNYFLWSHHHALLDGTSFNIIVYEFTTLINKEELRLNFRSYSDYAHEFIHNISTSDYLKKISKKIQKKKIDIHPSKKITHHEYWLDIPKDLVNSMKTIARDHNITLNHLFTSILCSSSLQLFSEKKEICIGTVHNTRVSAINRIPIKTSDDVIGNALNIIPIIHPIVGDYDSNTLIKNAIKIKSAFTHVSKALLCDTDKHFNVGNNETIYDVVIFFDNLRFHQWKEKLRTCGIEITTFEQVHYPLNALFNDNESPAVGFEYCRSHYSHNQISTALNSMISLFHSISQSRIEMIT